MSSSTRLQQALTDSLSSGIFVDTKFYVFSKREHSTSRVSFPRALYANSHILKQIQYFETLLGDTYSEGNLVDMRSDFPALEDPFTEEYEYWSDSDLEDDDSESDGAGKAQVSPSDEDLSEESLPRVYAKFGRVVSETHAYSRSIASSILHSDHESNEQKGLQEKIFQEDDKAKLFRQANKVHIGKMVVIRDVAFTTPSPLHIYGRDRICSFGSEKNRKSHATSVTNNNAMPKASPKSIYRIADKYDIPDLKRLAFNNICDNLEKCDVVEELFSRFTSRYPKIRDAEAYQLAIVLRRPDSMPTVDLLKKKIQSFAEGELPYCSEAFSVLYGLVSDKWLKPTVEVLPIYPITFKFPCPIRLRVLNTLKTALNKSLTTSTFLDAQIYAPSARSPTCSSSKLLPVYFSRAVVDPWLSKIKEYAITLDSNLLTFESKARQLEEEDSDVEDSDESETRANGEGSVKVSISINPILENMSTEKMTETVMVCNVGAAATWKALFFWIYTDEVHFAPLCSQGKGVQEKWIAKRQRQHSHQPKPCSPKSLYTLADKLGLESLKNLAFANIKTKLSAENIVTEWFSRFTSSNPKVLDMENEIFEKLRNHSTLTCVRQNIQSMADGKFSHRSEALKAVFEITAKKSPIMRIR